MIGSGVSPLLPTADDMRAWGGTSSTDVLNGDYWRLFTSNYLHYGIIHLAANMFSFNNLGRMVEQFIGWWRFALLYTFAGIAGSAVSIWWNPFGLGAGASGAILGVVGILLALLTTNLIEKSVRMKMLRSMAISAGLMILIGMQANIDNAAHLGGLGAGMLGGYFIFPELKAHFYQKKKQFIGCVAACLVILGATGWFVMNAESPLAYVRTIEVMMNDFSQRESSAENNFEQGMYKTPEAIDKNVLEVYRYGLSQMDTIDGFDLNEQGKQYFENLQAYMVARMHYYEFQSKSIQSGGDTHKDSLEYWRTQSEAALKVVNSR